MKTKTFATPLSGPSLSLCAKSNETQPASASSFSPLKQKPPLMEIQKPKPKLTRNPSSLLRSSTHSLSSLDQHKQQISDAKKTREPPHPPPPSPPLLPLSLFSLLVSLTHLFFYFTPSLTHLLVFSLSLALFSLLLRNARPFLFRHRLKRTQSVQWFIGDDGERVSRNGSCPKSMSVKEGVEFFRNGDLYEGEFYKGSCNGSGVFNFFAKGRYEGDWVDGKYDGYGIESWAKGSRYKGQYRNGSRHGFGVYMFFNGDSYDGEWFSGQSHGRGVQTCADGSCYVGEFKSGVKHGLGCYLVRNGDRYAGEYFGDKIHGFGIYHFANGDCYEGSWHEGRRQGFGTYNFRSGEMTSGEWDCGVQKHSLPPSDHSVQRSVQAARKAAESAVLAPRVDEQVNKAVAAANRAATAARVAAIKAVQNRMDGKFCHTGV